MWVMALDTLLPPLVHAVRDARQVRPVAVWIIKKCMAAEAKVPACIQRQKFFVIRMIDRRSMAVFTLDRLVS